MINFNFLPHFLFLLMSSLIGYSQAAQKVELESGQSIEVGIKNSEVEVEVEVIDGRIQVLIRGSIAGKKVKKIISETETGLRESTYSQVGSEIVEVVDSNGDGHADPEESGIVGKKAKWQKGGGTSQEVPQGTTSKGGGKKSKWQKGGGR